MRVALVDQDAPSRLRACRLLVSAFAREQLAGSSGEEGGGAGGGGGGAMRCEGESPVAWESFVALLPEELRRPAALEAYSIRFDLYSMRPSLRCRTASFSHAPAATTHLTHTTLHTTLHTAPHRTTRRTVASLQSRCDQAPLSSLSHGQLVRVSTALAPRSGTRTLEFPPALERARTPPYSAVVGRIHCSRIPCTPAVL